MSDRRKKLFLIAAGAANINICLTAAAAIEHEQEKRKKPRSCWVKPCRESRNPGSDIQKLLIEYELYDSKDFKNFLSMDEDVFLEILNLVSNDIRRENTVMRKSIPAEQKLAATLRFLSTGESFVELAEHTKLSVSYLSTSVIEVCSAIYRNLSDLYLKFPDSPDKWKEISKQFENNWQFPLCLGALDSKHIAMTRFDRIVLLAVADAYGKFLFIDVGCNGRISDDGVFSRSILRRILENDNYFPEDQVLSNNHKLPYVIVADNAFPQGKHIITPFNSTNLAKDEIIYNQRLNRARQNIVRALGMLSLQFRIFQKTIPLQEQKTIIIVQACCVLHNFLMERSEWYKKAIGDMEINATQQMFPSCNSRDNNRKTHENIRDKFKKYFVNGENIINTMT